MKGKKFLISTVAMSLALAIALGGAFAYSKVQSNADGLNCEESEDFRRVVLPIPLEPTKAIFSPRSISKLRAEERGSSYPITKSFVWNK